MTKKKTQAPSPTSGPRVQVRFKSDKEVARIREAVEAINNSTVYGAITFNSFVSGVAFREADKILRDKKY
jgi:hypothetical protein